MWLARLERFDAGATLSPVASAVLSTKTPPVGPVGIVPLRYELETKTVQLQAVVLVNSKAFQNRCSMVPTEDCGDVAFVQVGTKPLPKQKSSELTPPDKHHGFSRRGRSCCVT